MHTVEVICNLNQKSYSYLEENLPALSTPVEYIKRTNFYSQKGIEQIELLTHVWTEKETQVICKSYYLVLRCNPSIIMGDSKVLLLDMNKYTADEVIHGLFKRLYEIPEFCHIRLHKLHINHFKVRRVDIAKDILVKDPKIIVWLSNMSFPYKHYNIERKPINKELDVLYRESCYFTNRSRTFNLYNKLADMMNKGKRIEPCELEQISKTVRLEIQIRKKGVSYLSTKLPTKRSLEPFLRKAFCDNYLEKEIKSLFHIEKYVSRSRAEEIINASNFKPRDKRVMLSIIDMIQNLKGLYELEKAIDDTTLFTPSVYGNLKSFRNRWLKKIRSLGIQPVVIPDSFEVDEIPSIYKLLTDKKGAI